MELDYKRAFEETIEISQQVTTSTDLYYAEDYAAAEQQVVALLERMKAFRAFLGDDSLFFRCNAACAWSSNMVAVLMDMEGDAGDTEEFSADDPNLATRAECCQELLDSFALDVPRARRCRIILADMYRALGDMEALDRQYEQQLSQDPTWGEGYLLWACNCTDTSGGTRKAIAILKQGIAQPVLDAGYADKAELLNELIDFCKEAGDTEAQALYEDQFRALQPTLPRSSRFFKQVPVRSQKIGRNEPCPCGSGKKYKNCCGA